MGREGAPRQYWSACGPLTKGKVIKGEKGAILPWTGMDWMREEGKIFRENAEILLLRKDG